MRRLFCYQQVHRMSILIISICMLTAFHIASALLSHGTSRDRRTYCSFIQCPKYFAVLQDPKATFSNIPSSFSKDSTLYHDMTQTMKGITLALVLAFSPLSGINLDAGNWGLPLAWAEDAATTITTSKTYDGFADYAKDNQMQQSDVGCFVKMCGEQTKALFSNPRGIKGVSCLGRCKGEQSCATRCFAEFGSEDLNNWLSCTIEENECVKVPKNVDNSAENLGYTSVVQAFDPRSLVGTWYKTDGLNPNYDLFDCQTNTFKPSASDDNELDMDIFFRVSRPGGGFWENAITEHMVLDASSAPDNSQSPPGRTMHTQGKMYGLQFSENWFVIGQSDGSGDVPPFKLVAYRGHTLQGNYEGAFVYAKEPVLPAKAIPAVKEAAAKAGLDFNQFTPIDNTCPTNEKALNDASAGLGTSTTDWINLVIGEGGVIDWISPGWRGEYKR